MKIITAEEAALLVNDGDVLATSGFMLSGVAEEVMDALEKRFHATGHPRDLTAMAAGGQGNWDSMGMDHLANKGMLKRLFEGYLGCEPRIGKMIIENEIECYNFPIGVMSAVFRALAQGKEGELTRLGLYTYLDPRLEGGKANERTTEDMVELLTVRGQEHLFYKVPPIDIAFVRGTYADEKGNITFENEPVPLETAYVAMAAKACGGIVVAQVESIAEFGSLRGRDVQIFGNLVDYVVVCTDREKYHRQTVQYFYHPALTGATRVPEESIAPLKLDVKKVIARRGALELRKGDTVNLGIGIPEKVAPVAAEEGIDILFTGESGLFGGLLLGGYSFGAGMNNWAVTDANTIFDFYMGGGLDIAYLGMAQVNAAGDVNVARFADRVTGSGGFVNITQTTRNVVFCGTFTTGGLEVEMTDGGIRIVKEGRSKKFIKDILQTTFSSRFAVETGQRILYLTERCVFQLTPEGLMLTEVAPGIDIEKDILGQMEFEPLMAKEIKTMDPRLFREEVMGLDPEPRVREKRR